MIAFYILGGIIIVIILLLALVGLDEVLHSRSIARWYEKKDRQHRLIKKLKEESNMRHLFYGGVVKLKLWKQYTNFYHYYIR